MNEHISDRRLQTFYKRKLHESQFAYAMKTLHSQAFCAVRLIKAPGFAPGVFVLKNNQEAKIWGVQHCKSPWSCPVCSAKQMAKTASTIATAIDALNAEGKKAFMITFSIPHLMKYTCKQVYDALEKTWLRFVHHGNKSSTPSVQKDIFVQFVTAIGCKHRIRVGEFTWGKNGWHPHYHCLFFCDADKLKDVAQWQDKLTERWLYIAKQMTIKSLHTLGNYTFAEAKEEVERLYKNITEPNEGAFISKNPDGTAREAKSSEYICGWGADRELTGNIRKKATAEGHYTPHQLLQIAYEYEQLNNIEECNKFMRIYFDYALTTYRKFRMRLSPTINKLVQKWRESNSYIRTLKKKAIERRETAGRWELVCWFKPEQWLQICLLHLEPLILERAMETNGKELITQLLLKHQIDITKNGNHHKQNFVVDKLFNSVA